MSPLILEETKQNQKISSFTQWTYMIVVLVHCLLHSLRKEKTIDYKILNIKTFKIAIFDHEFGSSVILSRLPLALATYILWNNFLNGNAIDEQIDLHINRWLITDKLNYYVHVNQIYKHRKLKKKMEKKWWKICNILNILITSVGNQSHVRK